MGDPSADSLRADERLRRAVEMRLRHRLEDFSRDLEDCAAGCETAAARGGGPSMGSELLAREALAGQSATLIERHAEQVLADLVSFLAEAGDTTLRPWLAARLEAHLEQVVARTLAALRDGPDRGLAKASAQRNRFTNLTAGIKARGRAALESAPVQPRRDPDGASEEAQELDDRLPLLRRKVFDRDLLALTGECAASGQPLGLVMVDLDHFKRINDEHGHPVGDEVLLTVSRLVVQRLGRKGRAYRYGGEELALLLPGYSWEEALGLAERIRKDVAAAPVTGRGIAVTASFGVACLPDDATDAPALLQRADQALYGAKHAGRNRAHAASAEVSTLQPGTQRP